MSGDRKSRIEYTSTHRVSRNMSLIVGKWVNVSVGSPINSAQMAVAGEALDQVKYMFGFSLDDFIVENDANEVLNASSVIEADVTLRLCHNVNISGVLNALLVIEHGTKLYQIPLLSQSLTLSHIILNQTNKSQVLDGNTPVLHDISIIIVNVSKQEFVIIFDDMADVNEDDIKNEITGIIPLPDRETLWIEVVQQEDGSFIVSVVQAYEQSTDISDILTGCMNHMS